MILIENALIYTMADDVIENGSILIENGKIKEIGEKISKPEGDIKIIDAKGNLVTPGFIDAHTHLGLFEEGIGFEGSDGNEAVDPVTPHLRAIDAINPMDLAFKESREYGVTTAITGPGSANVIGGTFAAIKTYGNRVDDMVFREPVAMKIAFGENPKRVYSGQKRSPATRMGTVATLREVLFKTQEYLRKKELAEKESEKPGFDMKLEAMIPVLKKEIPLKAHAHRADDIFTALRIAEEFDLNITLDHCTEGHLIADEIKESNKPAIVGPSFGSRTKFELQNTTYETAKILNEKGVLISITTDAPVIPLKHLSLCAGLAHKEGLDEMEAFKAITINPAIIAGVDDRVGSLEVGKDADIVIFEGNPIKDVNFKTLVTIIDGNIVHEL